MSTFTPTNHPPAKASTVTVFALYNDNVTLASRENEPPTTPRFTFAEFENLESIVKAGMLLGHGALVQQTRMVGTIDEDIAYVAVIARLDRVAPPNGQRTHPTPLEEAARLLHAELGPAADAILNAAIHLRDQGEQP